MANRIVQFFEEKKQNVLNIYFTAGYPTLESAVQIIGDLAAAGVDLIEVGMPYSDPLADGLTIQQSSKKALQNGMTLDILFGQIKEAREFTEVPLLLMGYFNQMLQYGTERFCKACADSGIDGLIIPDLPMDIYEESYQNLIQKYGLKISFLITPQTSDERIRLADRLSEGFVYMVSSAATTGAKTNISDAQIAYFERVEAMQLQHPRLIGFGISNRTTFQRACAYSNGAIIGSAFIQALSQDAETTSIRDFVKGILEG